MICSADDEIVDFWIAMNPRRCYLPEIFDDM